jgi:hypothetical protein
MTMWKETKPAGKCEKCGQRTTSPEGAYFCDACGIKMSKNQRCTNVSFHFRHKDLKSMQVCSAKCLLDLYNRKKGLNFSASLLHLSHKDVVDLLKLFKR